MDTTKELSAIEWCAGYGGIHLGLKRAIPSLRVIAYGEIEAFACANLVAKMEAGLMDCAPIWTDIKTFPCEEFRDRVGLLVAGYPCQPFSAAGKRLGPEDPRHLWPHIARAIRVIRPRLCFFENVEGHISLGLREVLGDLGAAGYTAAWGIFSASEVGAPHQRKRVFILAYRHGERGQLPDWWRVTAEQVPVGYGETWRDGRELVNAELHGRQDWQHDNSGPQLSGRHSVAWPSRPGEQQYGWEPPRVCGGVASGSWVGPSAMGNASQREDHGRESRDMGIAPSQGGSSNDAADGTSEVLGNTGNQRCEKTERALRGKQQSSGASEECGLGVAEAMGNAASERRARQAIECMGGTEIASTGCGIGKIESNVGLHSNGTSDGLGHAELSGLCDSELAEIREWMVKCDNRTDELRLLGNGVVPATAERAFRTLMEELQK